MFALRREARNFTKRRVFSQGGEAWSRPDRERENFGGSCSEHLKILKRDANSTLTVVLRPRQVARSMHNAHVSTQHMGKRPINTPGNHCEDTSSKLVDDVVGGGDHGGRAKILCGRPLRIGHAPVGIKALGSVGGEKICARLNIPWLRVTEAEHGG